MRFLFLLFPVSVFASTVCWEVPTERADGEPLPVQELSGYYIYSGETSGVYQVKEFVEGGETTCFETKENGPYFVVTAIDTEKRESEYSAEAKKPFPPKSPSAVTVQ